MRSEAGADWFDQIKATFLTDYAHTCVIIVIIFIFAFTAYATNEVIGSPSKVYDLLVEAAKSHPVEGNAEGSYLTMRSQQGGIFFVINICGNFATVSDQVETQWTAILTLLKGLHG